MCAPRPDLNCSHFYARPAPRFELQPFICAPRFDCSHFYVRPAPRAPAWQRARGKTLSFLHSRLWPRGPCAFSKCGSHSPGCTGRIFPSAVRGDRNGRMTQRASWSMSGPTSPHTLPRHAQGSCHCMATVHGGRWCPAASAHASFTPPPDRSKRNESGDRPTSWPSSFFASPPTHPPPPPPPAPTQTAMDMPRSTPILPPAPSPSPPRPTPLSPNDQRATTSSTSTKEDVRVQQSSP